MDILLIGVSVDGVDAMSVVDTGSPIVALDPGAFPGAAVPDGEGTVSLFGIGALVIHDAPVVGANLITSSDPTLPIGASLGASVLSSFAVALDYRGSTVTFDPVDAPEGTGADLTVPFELEGGGSMSVDGVTGTVSFPASRIPVVVDVEGATYSLIVDTGSSLVVLREALFSRLTADGRGALGGIGTVAPGSTSTSSVTRARTFDVSGAAVDGLVVSADSALEPALDAVAAEIGRPVDGLVGGSFFRHFYVTIDYPHGRLHLQAYTSGAPTYDLFDRVGISLACASAGTPATVSHVFAGTDAATLGVAVGDVVLAVDQRDLAPLGQTAVDALLSGPVGTTKTIRFGAAASASLQDRSVTIAVQDVLPL
jgi:hypothetical protein